jgi:Uncharacterized conserved protein
MSKTLQTNRYLALDILRGMTVAGMILVNNPGSWGKIFPPLRHAAWHGCTPTDLVFPFFLFVVGVAMAFSFAKYSSAPTGKAWKKLIIRSFAIFGVGLLLNAFPFYPTSPKAGLSFWAGMADYWGHLRIFGVLQRIAMAYFMGGALALWLRKPKKIMWGVLAVLLLHWALLCFFGGDDPYSKEGNFAGIIDRWLLGEQHLYRGFGLAFDPEGLLGMISGAGTVLLGYLAGKTIQNSPQKIDAVGRLYTFALLGIGLAIVWSNWLPINKPLWTSSYVLYTAGWASMMLAFFIYLVDVVEGWGRIRFSKLFYPFKALGMNPLFAFVMAGLFAKILGRMIRWETLVPAADGSLAATKVSVLSWFYQDVCVGIFGHNELGSLVFALCYVAVFTGMAIFLYRRKIFIKL